MMRRAVSIVAVATAPYPVAAARGAENRHEKPAFESQQALVWNPDTQQTLGNARAFFRFARALRLLKAL
jgi:hypothetical protein